MTTQQNAPVLDKHRDEAAKAAGWLTYADMNPKTFAAGLVRAHAQTLANLEAANNRLAEIERMIDATTDVVITGSLVANIRALASGHTPSPTKETVAMSQPKTTFDHTIERITRESIAESLAAIGEAFDALFADRDEWAQQHENLLEVRQQDIAALTTPSPCPSCAAKDEAMEAFKQRVSDKLMENCGGKIPPGSFLSEFAIIPPADPVADALKAVIEVWYGVPISVGGNFPAALAELNSRLPLGGAK